MCLACLGLATACDVHDAALPAAGQDHAASRQAASQDRLPAQPGRAADAEATQAGQATSGTQVRPAPHAPVIVVEGRGAYADALAQRIRADLPDGWGGRFQVDEPCREEDCLHWALDSADGLQRVEKLPAIEVPVVVPEAGERHVDPRIVLAHAETMRTRLFPGSRALGREYYRFEDRVSNSDLTLSVGYEREGTPMRAEVHVWLQLVDATPSQSDGDTRQGTLRTHVRSAPVRDFDGDRLREQVQYQVRLEREGWDPELDRCFAQAWMIASMAYVGAGEDSRAAVQACERAWALRRQPWGRSELDAGGA